MELRQLRTFVTAAERESFTRAAKDLNVTQPAVSQQVAALEHELGVSLFRRRGRNITLTESGRYLYRYARKALALLDEVSHDIGQTENAVTGTIQIASCSVPTETFLPELIAAFRHVYPNVREVLSVSNSIAATKAVETGAAELGFTVVQPRGTYLSATEIMCHELVLVCSLEHPLATGEHLTVEQLRGETFIVREPSSETRYLVERVLNDMGISPSELIIGLETNSSEAVRAAVKRGIGVAFLSQSAVADDLAQCRLVTVNVKDLHVRQSIYLVTDPRRMPTAAVRAFLSFVK